MRKKPALIAAMIMFLGISVWAGDIAVFVDFGFSPDGKTYMCGQYGVQSGTLYPWADLYIIDVSSNDFVTDGRISYVHTEPISAGQDGSEVLYRLLARNSGLAERYNVGFLNPGYPLYVLPDNGISDGETIEFRDFEKNIRFRAKIIPQKEGYGTGVRSSFIIDLDCDRGNYTVGNALIKRQGISEYKIRKVVAAPKDGSIVFIIEMKKQNDGGGVDIRYMIEAVRL